MKEEGRAATRLAHCWHWEHLPCALCCRLHHQLRKTDVVWKVHALQIDLRASTMDAEMIEWEHCVLIVEHVVYASSAASVGAKATNARRQFNYMSSRSCWTCCKQSGTWRKLRKNLMMTF
jgi:hypothetical protein